MGFPRGAPNPPSSPSTASLSGVARSWHSNAYFSLFSSLFFFDPPNRLSGSVRAARWNASGGPGELRQGRAESSKKSPVRDKRRVTRPGSKDSGGSGAPPLEPPF